MMATIANLNRLETIRIRDLAQTVLDRQTRVLSTLPSAKIMRAFARDAEAAAKVVGHLDAPRLHELIEASQASLVGMDQTRVIESVAKSLAIPGASSIEAIIAATRMPLIRLGRGVPADADTGNPATARLPEADRIAMIDNWLRRGDVQPDELAELLQEYRGAEPRGRAQRQRSPDRDMAEVIEIVNRWLKWKKLGYSQQAFCEAQGWGSRTILSRCLERYRQEFGDTPLN